MNFSAQKKYPASPKGTGYFFIYTGNGSESELAHAVTSRRKAAGKILARLWKDHGGLSR